MFEIYSEQGGRSEKILDLLQDGAELNLQQHQIKGLHEVRNLWSVPSSFDIDFDVIIWNMHLFRGPFFMVFLSDIANLGFGCGVYYDLYCHQN